MLDERMIRIVVAFIVSPLTVLIITPIVKRIAIKIGAVDQPSNRKVHDKIMPRMGGLAIFIGVVAGVLASGIYTETRMTAITVGAFIIIVLGILDDKYQLSAKVKFLIQLGVAIMIVSTGLKMDFFSVPFLTERFELGWMAYPLTVLWIVGITNAINLIDGLDGLLCRSFCYRPVNDRCHGAIRRKSAHSVTLISRYCQHAGVFVLQLPSGKNLYGRYGITVFRV